jgi:uncharacterized protein (DUF983 family)
MPLADPVGPFEGLDPHPPSHEGAPGSAEVGWPHGKEPSAVRALLRGLAKRCPRCGERRVFADRLTLKPQCPRCGLRLQREEGGFLGAMTVNYAVTTLVWVAFLAAWLIIDLPEVRVAPLTISSVVLVAVVPMLFYPNSKTIWAAVDYLVFRSDPDYGSKDASERAPGNGGTY